MELLPDEFLTFVKFSAGLGFFSFVALSVAAEYKLFERIVGEEKAKKYRLVFVLANVAAVLVFIFIFLIFFRRKDEPIFTKSLG